MANAIRKFFTWDLCSIMPFSYWISCVTSTITYGAFIYGLTMSEKPGSFLTCLIGLLIWWIISFAINAYIAKIDFRSKFCHNCNACIQVGILASLIHYLII